MFHLILKNFKISNNYLSNSIYTSKDFRQLIMKLERKKSQYNNLF